MSYMDHMWINSENLSDRLDMLVFCMQEVLARNNIDWELPEDFSYLKFNPKDSKHKELSKEYHEALYEKLGRLIDDMSKESYVTDGRKLPNLKEIYETIEEQ